MSPTVALILGLLIGWLIEWVIDWVYWRRRTQTIRGDAARCQEKLASYEAVLKTLRASSGRVPPVEDDRAVRQVPAQAMASAPITPEPAVELIPDNLEVINGIGPVIARKLNQVGVYTFEQLAALSPGDFRNLLGDAVQRLADEESLIEQARQLAARKHGQGTGGQ